MIKPGIKQIGGNFRTRKLLDNYTPKHEFFLSMFLGAGWYELNKPRCQYELFNDKNSDIINYFEVMTFHPKEFDEKKLFGKGWIYDIFDQLELAEELLFIDKVKVINISLSTLAL
ncbi:hypothetical protein LCGC14_0809910 [marine sediment metagenome]|uniref:site-specific DNA-methyltransferase (adenine-specific) n=1 Tax=marine sediment metagenome TaxID=412755 RepID=A0A0F9PRN4_9ZZZZ